MTSATGTGRGMFGCGAIIIRVIGSSSAPKKMFPYMSRRSRGFPVERSNRWENSASRIQPRPRSGLTRPPLDNPATPEDTRATAPEAPR
jgi:hypothetical protein